ncbi:hypothetical protein SAMN05216252_114116 [Actinacidiphila glaucinigra]|uniref:Uncharacterized protein n=1 Tax=Actinacidiphila glaucinigra TaxID=235986 RepID=A0A239K0L2_9ACTN|nr:hypothetical protein SAMN05216252_114116 [Actinacidiphila glaucinigra]
MDCRDGGGADTGGTDRGEGGAETARDGAPASPESSGGGGVAQPARAQSSTTTAGTHFLMILTPGTQLHQGLFQNRPDTSFNAP